MPELVGSRKPRQALAVIAASAAEPPRFRVSIAARVARGCAVPAAPEHPMAADREAKLAPGTRSPAWTSGRTKRSAPSGWNFGSSCGAAAALWLRAFGELTDAMEPAAARGRAAIKERRRKVFSRAKG